MLTILMILNIYNKLYRKLQRTIENESIGEQTYELQNKKPCISISPGNPDNSSVKNLMRF